MIMVTVTVEFIWATEYSSKELIACNRTIVSPEISIYAVQLVRRDVKFCVSKT